MREAFSNQREAEAAALGAGVRAAPGLEEAFPGFCVEPRAVVADDEETAQRAVELVEVEYEELPAVLDPEAAMADGSQLVHPDVQEALLALLAELLLALGAVLPAAALPRCRVTAAVLLVG